MRVVTFFVQKNRPRCPVPLGLLGPLYIHSCAICLGAREAAGLKQSHGQRSIALELVKSNQTQELRTRQQELSYSISPSAMERCALGRFRGGARLRLCVAQKTATCASRDAGAPSLNHHQSDQCCQRHAHDHRNNHMRAGAPFWQSRVVMWR